MTTFPVEQRGVGKPDYSKEISLGQIRPGISLKVNQQIKSFFILPAIPDIVAASAFPWVRPIIGPDDAAHLIDAETGIPMPWMMPAGYGLTLIDHRWTFNQDMEEWGYLDTQLVICGSVLSAGSVLYQNALLGYSTLTIDPTATDPHLIDIQIINRGGANMRGGLSFICILEAIGTPPFPTSKDTQCPHCSLPNNPTINRVDVHTTKIICPKCGREYWVYDYSRFRRSA